MSLSTAFDIGFLMGIVFGVSVVGLAHIISESVSKINNNMEGK